MSRRLVLDDGRSQRELVVKERMTVGRDPGCDISDGDPRLSRRHAEFLATPSGLMVRDLESRNGILVNGVKTRQASLSHGDVVQIGHLQVKYVDEVGPFTDVPSPDAAPTRLGDAAATKVLDAPTVIQDNAVTKKLSL